MAPSARSERYLHRAFQATLLFKAIFAVAEIGAGFGAIAISGEWLLGLAQVITHEELLEDPRDMVANYLLDSTRHLSVASRHFMAAYLVSHGVVKLALIVALLRKKTWAYPAALAVFTMFIVYQLYRYTVTSSPSLLLLTVVDLVVIALTWNEYAQLRDERIAKP